MKPGDRQTFVVPIRSVREEASDLLRVMEIGQPDVIIRARERLKAALAAEETPSVMQVVDEIVNRADAAGLGAFVPKSYREQRAARTGTVPLLEYLDKLEATDKRDTAYCTHPAACSEHHDVPVRLALIAKLREAVRLAVKLSLQFPVERGLQVEVDRLEYIEVPS